MKRDTQNLTGWRRDFYVVLFEGDTPAAKLFDGVLIVVIVASVLAVMLESVVVIDARYHVLLAGLEWSFTIIFTVEYILRLVCVGKPLRYARSFYGIIDVLAVIPTYLSLILPGVQALLVIRILRVFRVFKLVKYFSDADNLFAALKSSWRRITIFFIAVMALVTVLGSLMYLIEGADNGFDSIPRSVYWAIVTLTTVGYGDISPHTPLGQALAAVVMIIGYGIIAIGIMARVYSSGKEREHVCVDGQSIEHDQDALFCKKCGRKL